MTDPKFLHARCYVRQLRSWDVNSGVGITALLVAACRAVESSRGDAIAVDSYAAGFVAAGRAALPTTLAEVVADQHSAPTWLTLTDFVAVRTRVFDDFMKRDRDGIGQVVLLAAGLDTRAMRMTWPEDFNFYEIDQPAVLGFKASVLTKMGASAPCRHQPVPCDLRSDWGASLLAAGFSPSVPTVWLSEGLMPYLDATTTRRMLVTMRDLSAAGSRVALESIPDLRRALTETVMATTGSTIGVDIPALVHIEQSAIDLRPLLAELRWRVRSVNADDAAAELARPSSQTSPLRFTKYIFGELAKER
jgi:methyltransferase (TIGR00027 family)